jgi:hypothetical protein
MDTPVWHQRINYAICTINCPRKHPIITIKEFLTCRIAGLSSASAAAMTASIPSRLYTLKAPTAYPLFSASFTIRAITHVYEAINDDVYP